MIDNFERAAIGPNWTNTPFTGGALTIVGASDLTGSGAEVVGFWNANTPDTATYACGQFSGTSASFSGVCLGVDGVSGGNGMCCVAITGGPAAWAMFSRTNGSGATVESAGSPTFVAGDYMGIQRTLPGTSFRCFRSTNGTTWTALGAGGSAIMPTPGHSGVDMTPAGFPLEVWESGNGTLPTGRACGTP